MSLEDIIHKGPRDIHRPSPSISNRGSVYSPSPPAVTQDTHSQNAYDGYDTYPSTNLTLPPQLSYANSSNGSPAANEEVDLPPLSREYRIAAGNNGAIGTHTPSTPTSASFSTRLPSVTRPAKRGIAQMQYFDRISATVGLDLEGRKRLKAYIEVSVKVLRDHMRRWTHFHWQANDEEREVLRIARMIKIESLLVNNPPKPSTPASTTCDNGKVTLSTDLKVLTAYLFHFDYG